jgi:hypothetical protein
MSEPKNISDKLKQTIDELEIDRHVNDLVIQVEDVVLTARDKVATLAAERGVEVERFLDKVSTTIDERTEGRYSSEFQSVRGAVMAGVAKLAAQRPTDKRHLWPVDEIKSPPAEEIECPPAD